MQRILVLGCPGSGKSTFAARLHDASGLPLYHLDNLWWKPDRTHVPRDEFDARLDELLGLDRWIIDGDYRRTYERRVAACDMAIFLDYGEDVCMEGIVKRVGQTRDDIPWTEHELDPELVDLVRRYEHENRPTLLQLFAKYPDKRVVVLHSRAEANRWLASQYGLGEGR